MSLSNAPLGQPVDYPSQYDPGLLFPIARSHNRAGLNLSTSLPFMGVDIWNAYELSWLDAKGMPAGVDLISVATAIDPNRPNYPPDAWLAREHWSVPVIVDADGRIATRYGLTAFPFWVAVRADGTVAQRLTGELTPEQLDALVASVSTP